MGTQSAKAEAPDRRAIETIFQYLEDLKTNRPSAVMRARHSAKGGRTVLQILAAAKTVFIRDGHAGLSLRKVAAEAGVAVGNVSYYFTSKHQLLEAMLHETLAEYVDQHALQFESEEDTPLEILLNIVGFYVRNSRTSHQFFYQLWGYAGSDERAKKMIRDLYRPIGRFIYYLIRASNDDLADSDIRRITLQIFSIEEGMKLFIGMGPDGDPALSRAEEDLRALTERLVCDP